MTQHIHYIFHAFRCAVHGIRKTAVSGLLVMAAVVALSSCSADEAGGDTMVKRVRSGSQKNTNHKIKL